MTKEKIITLVVKSFFFFSRKDKNHLNLAAFRVARPNCLEKQKISDGRQQKPFSVSTGTILLLALWGHEPSITLWPLKHCWEHHIHIHQEAQIQVKSLNKLNIIWGINLDTY